VNAVSGDRFHSTVAQQVERATVNRVVPGSIPGRGAIFFSFPVHVAQLAAQRDVTPRVTGSSPVVHPIFIRGHSSEAEQPAFNRQAGISKFPARTIIHSTQEAF
jgi:hypothetical protein